MACSAFLCEITSDMTFSNRFLWECVLKKYYYMYHIGYRQPSGVFGCGLLIKGDVSKDAGFL